MSGGHFDYVQYRIEDLASEVDELIKNNDDEDLGYHFSSQIIYRFKEAAHVAKQAAEMVQRIDWLVSGDDSEEDFLTRWTEEVRE